jgi:hypothetical protein
MARKRLYRITFEEVSPSGMGFEGKVDVLAPNAPSALERALVIARKEATWKTSLLNVKSLQEISSEVR